MGDVFANKRSILHKGDGQQHISGPPDACKTPTPGGPVPIPYPNIAMDSDLAKGAKKVKINGKPVATEASNLSTSTGDEAGTAGGGLLSSKTKGKLTWGSVSGDVKVEGKGVARFMDVTEHNGNVWNTVITAQGEVTTEGYGDDPIDSPDCLVCEKKKSAHRIESDGAVLKLAQELAAKLRDKNGAFHKSFHPVTMGNKLDELGNAVMEEVEVIGKKGKVSRKKKAVLEEKPRPLKNGVMIGVLACQCHTKENPQKVYAALAARWETDGAYKDCGSAFESEAKSLGLTPITEAPTPPPQAPLNGPSPISDAKWKAVQQAAVDANKPAAGNEILTCAAPKMIQACLKSGHKPGKMIEIYVAMIPEKTVMIPKYLKVVVDERTSPPVTKEDWVPEERFGDNAKVPSCTTCQVVLTAMLCNLNPRPCK